MTEAHWFSNFCPHFSVFDAEKFFLSGRRDRAVTVRELEALGFSAGARWLEARQDQWREHLSRGFETLKRREAQMYEIIFWGDENFPPYLKTVHFPPSVLFVKGDIHCLQGELLSMVGARHPTDLGRLWVRGAMKELIAENFVIVSGGARGIDSECHLAALEHGGKTVAVLPGGIDKPYPSSNHYIFRRIEKSGALVSEFLPGTTVRMENFHRRNRLIAGAGKGVVIVEAALKSGTMMTANRALSEHREVCVVPGPPMLESYAGSLELLTQGAGLARDAKDVVKLIREKRF